MADTTQAIPRLAKAFLCATQRRALQRQWRHSRNAVRGILRRSRRPCYLASQEARADLGFLLALYGRVTAAGVKAGDRKGI